MSGSFQPYRSLTALREAHRHLLSRRREGETAAFLTDVEQFIRQGRVTGALLDSDEDRWQAQNLLDYWANELFHALREPPEAALADFDPAQAPELDDSQCPYLGLVAYGTAHHKLFFGQDRLVQKMIERLGDGRLLTLTGPPGSGKTSAVLAGLLPKLQAGALPHSQHWRYLPAIQPGTDPLFALARLLLPTHANPDEWIPQTIAHCQKDPNHLTQLMAKGEGKTAVLIINQFEEIYTLCQDAAIRQAAIANLLRLIQADDGPILILTLRSNTENALALTPALQSHIDQSQVRITVMNAADMRQTIEKPAELVGLNFEDGLVDELIREILGEPAALPLLQFNLLKLWEKRQRNLITWAAYEEIGGGREAIAHTANALYAEMSQPEQAAVRRILLALIRPQSGFQFQPMRTLRRSLYQLAADRVLIDRALDQLILAHLLRQVKGITPDEDQVEITHEAMIDNWPRLIGWLEEAYVARRRRGRLTTMAEQWQALQQDPNTLLRGVLLDEAAQFPDLSPLETAFIAASQAAAAAEREKRVTAERHKRRTAQRFAGVLMIFLAAAVALAGLAVNNGRTAETLRITAEASALTASLAQSTAVADADLRATAEAEANQQRDRAHQNAAAAEFAAEAALMAQATAEASAAEAEIQSRLAASRELAAAAIDQLTNDPQLGLLLAIEAVNLTYAADGTTPAEAEDALYRTLQASQLQRTLSGHTDWLAAVAISPDGRLAATAGRDSAIQLWDMKTGELIQTLTEHNGAVNDLDFNPTSDRLASAGDDGLKVWDIATGEAVFTRLSSTAVRGVAFHPDGQQIVAAYADSTVRLWNAATGLSVLRLFGHLAALNDVAFRPDGRQFATTSDDGSVIIWDTATGQPIRSLPATLGRDSGPVAVKRLNYSPDGGRLVTAAVDGIARIWNADTGDRLLTLSGHTSLLFDAAFSPDGRLLVTASGDGTAKVWQADSGRPLYTLGNHNGGMTAAVFSPDSQFLLTASQDSNARLWQTEPGLDVLTLSGQSGPVYAADFSPGGTLIASAGQDSIRIWDSAAGLLQQTLTLTNTGVTAVIFNTDGMELFTLSQDGAVRVWQMGSGAAPLTITAPDSQFTTLALNPAGDRLATGSEAGVVHLWRPLTGEMVDSWTYGRTITALAFNQSGNSVAIGDVEGSVTLLDVETGEMLAAVPGQSEPIITLAFHPTLPLLARNGRDGTIELWRLPEGTLQRTFSGHGGVVLSARFSLDGNRLATASADRSVKVWDLAAGQVVRTLPSHGAAVNQVVFSPDGSRLASASSDGTVQIYELESLTDLLARGLARAASGLTPEQCRQYLRERPCVTLRVAEDTE